MVTFRPFTLAVSLWGGVFFFSFPFPFSSLIYEDEYVFPPL